MQGCDCGSFISLIDPGFSVSSSDVYISVLTSVVGVYLNGLAVVVTFLNFDILICGLIAYPANVMCKHPWRLALHCCVLWDCKVGEIANVM